MPQTKLPMQEARRLVDEEIESASERMLKHGIKAGTTPYSREAKAALRQLLMPLATGEVRNKNLAARVAARLGVSMSQGENALNAVLDSIQDALVKGDRVVLTGFGTFEVRDMKARKVRSIQGEREGELVTIPAHKRVGFTAGAELSKAAQEQGEI